MAEQLRLPIGIHRQELTAFLEQWCALEDEGDRVRMLMQELRAQCQEQEMPIRGILAAVKIARTIRKMEQHAKEPMGRADLMQLVLVVDAYLQQMDEAKAAAVREAMGDATEL